MKRIVVALTVTALVVACGGKENAPALQATRTAAVVQQPAAEVPESSSPTITGTVVETMDGGGYTYIQLKSESGLEWAAVGATAVKKGDTVTLLPQVTMEKFQSNALNRTFDRIIFGSLASGDQKGSMMPGGHPAVPGATPAAAADEKIDVARADSPDGKRVAEVWSGRAGLADKKAVVRGKVVKFLPGIMGKNWVHIRDGSGSREKGDDDLTVTTNDVAAVGDVVVVSGVVRADKDFGSGYSYAVIIEEAKISK